MPAPFPSPVAPAPFAGLTLRDLELALGSALSGGGDFAEVYLERRILRSVRLEEGDVRAVRVGADSGLGVRVHAGERTGYASTGETGAASLQKAARAAAGIASGETRSVEVELPGSAAAADPPESPEEVALDQGVALVRRLEAAARAEDPRVKQVVASLSEQERWFQVASSEGLLMADRQHFVGATIMVLVESGQARQRGYYAAGGRDGLKHFERATPEAIAREAVRRAVVQLDAVEAPAGPQPVVIGNGWGGVLLHEAVGHGFEADFVRRGTSIYSGRVGEQVGSSLCTIIDDGSLAGLRGSVRVDDEGSPGRATLVVEKGILRGFLHDRLSARLLGAAPTGNGRRQTYRSIPIPRQTNLYMAAGQEPPEEILRGVVSGLYARHLGGGQVDITNGNFVFQITEGYLIQDGRLTAPVKNANLIGVGHEVLSRISRVGCDLEFDPGIGLCGKEGQSVPVGVGQPTLLVSSLTVGGTRI